MLRFVEYGVRFLVETIGDLDASHFKIAELTSCETATHGGWLKNRYKFTRKSTATLSLQCILD